MPAFDRAFADNLKEIAAIAGNKAQPTFANTIDALERCRGVLDHVSAVFYNLSGTDTRRRSRRSSARSRRALPSTAWRIYQNRQAVPRVDALMKRRQAWPQRRSRPACWSAITAASSSPARRSTPRRESGSRPLPSGRDAWHQVQPERAGRRAGLFAGAGGRRRPGRTARSRAGRCRADRHRARAHGQARDHAVAVEHRAVPEILGAARPAREGVQGLDQARRQGRQDRQPQDRRRDSEAEGRTRASAGLQDAGRLDARILDGQDARQREQAADGRVGAGAQARAWRSATSCRRPCRPRAATSSSPPGTGATTRRRCARPASMSTRRRSSPTCSSTTSSPPPSTWPTSCSA